MAAIELRHTSLFNDPNLQAYYQLEDLTDSIGGHTLTNVNTVPFNAAEFNNGADFGSANINKYLKYLGNIVAGNSDLTVSFWVKLDTEVDGTSIQYDFLTLDTLIGVDRYLDFDYQFNGGTRQLHVDASGGVITYVITLGTTNLYHVVLTRNISGNATILYINGVSVGSGTPGTTNGGLTEFTIGAHPNPANFSSAIIDDVAIFNRVLSSSEIAGLYNGTLSGASSPSSSVSASISPSASVSPSHSISPSSSFSASVSPSASISPSHSISPSSSSSPSLSPSSSISASISPSASLSPSNSISSSISPSNSVSSSTSPSPSQGYSLYSRAAKTILPINDTDLDTLYNNDEVLKVSAYDVQIVSQDGSLAYMLHQFKSFIGINTTAEIEFVGRSDLSPVLSPVYLQIFNQSTKLWETIAVNTDGSVDIDFSLITKLTDTKAYKDSSNLISCRVYQLAI